MKHERNVPRFGPMFKTFLVIALVLFGGYFGWRAWRSLKSYVTTQQHIRNLANPDATVREDAAAQLTLLGENFSPKLKDLLVHEESSIRQFACEQLGVLRPLDESAISLLVNRLSDSEPMVRCNAAHAIASYASLPLKPSDADSAISNLVGATSDPNSDVRESVAYALGQLGKASNAAVSALKAALSDSAPSVRLRAAWSLYEIDQENISLMIPIVRDALSGSDIAARDFAIAIVDQVPAIAPKGISAQSPP